MSIWHYAKDGQKQGPVETSQIQSLISNGTLTPQTLVWKQGMANWVAANTLPEFSASDAPPPVPTSTPPSSSPTVPALPPIGSANAPITCNAADVEKNKIFAILAYIGILFVVPLLAARESKFAMYHANQGIVLFLVAVVLGIALSIVSMILWYIPMVGWMISGLAHMAFMVGIVVLMVLGILSAAKGECKPLPVIGDRFTLIK